MNALKSFWGSIVRTWRNGRRGKIGIGCAALFISCAVCALCAQIYSMTPQAQESARATAQVVALAADATATERSKPTGTPAPTDTPAPTGTPAPTITSGPTDTPPPPTSTPSPSDALRAIAQTQFGAELIEVKIADVFEQNYATVDYDLGLQWDEGSAVLSAQSDFIEFAPKVFDMEEVDALELRAFTEFKDALGNSKRDVAIKFTVQRELADRINWDGIERGRLEVALNSADGNGVYVHPALRAAWSESQK